MYSAQYGNLKYWFHCRYLHVSEAISTTFNKMWTWDCCYFVRYWSCYCSCCWRWWRLSRNESKSNGWKSEKMEKNMQSHYFSPQPSVKLIEGFSMTSRRRYCCPKAMERGPCRCPKPDLWELNLRHLCKNVFFVLPINLQSYCPRERKRSIKTLKSKNDVLGMFLVLWPITVKSWQPDKD